MDSQPLVTDDSSLNYVLTASDQYPYGEERRLFYVAITRAKIKLGCFTMNVSHLFSSTNSCIRKNSQKRAMLPIQMPTKNGRGETAPK